MLVAVALIGYKLGWYEYRPRDRAHSTTPPDSQRRGFDVLFVIAFGIGTSVGVPGLPFIVVAGVLFGTLLGSILSWLGAMIGATIGYWVARTIGHDVIRAGSSASSAPNSAVAEARHFSGILRLRLIPVLPLGTVNFVGGLARAPFLPYLAATAIGVLPAILIYTYFADRLLERVGNGRADAMQSLIVASVLLMFLSLTPRLFAREKPDQSTVI